MNLNNEWVEVARSDWDSRDFASRRNWLQVSELPLEEAAFRFAELSPNTREAIIQDTIEFRNDLETEISNDLASEMEEKYA